MTQVGAAAITAAHCLHRQIHRHLGQGRLGGLVPFPARAGAAGGLSEGRRRGLEGRIAKELERRQLSAPEASCYCRGTLSAEPWRAPSKQTRLGEPLPLTLCIKISSGRKLRSRNTSEVVMAFLLFRISISLCLKQWSARRIPRRAAVCCRQQARHFWCGNESDSGVAALLKHLRLIWAMRRERLRKTTRLSMNCPGWRAFHLSGVS